MQSKILLIALSVAAFSSCSTAYKSGQTPDDVYYSPPRSVESDYRNENDSRNQASYRPATDYEITMAIRDARWRNFNNDYDYSYSPYYYATCNAYNYGYYYNPYYYPWAIYTGKISGRQAINTTPRMVNLNAYNGYNSRVALNKTNGLSSFSNSSSGYNNSNRSSSRNEASKTRYPNSNSSSRSNETRTYSPSSSNSSNGSSSSGSNSGSSISRPNRGG